MVAEFGSGMLQEKGTVVDFETREFASADWAEAVLRVASMRRRPEVLDPWEMALRP